MASVPAYQVSTMVTKGEREKAILDLQLQRHDEVEARIATIEHAVGLPPAGLLALNHAAIHDLGCKIVARALNIKGNSDPGLE